MNKYGQYTSVCNLPTRVTITTPVSIKENRETFLSIWDIVTATLIQLSFLFNRTQTTTWAFPEHGVYHLTVQSYHLLWMRSINIRKLGFLFQTFEFLRDHSEMMWPLKLDYIISEQPLRGWKRPNQPEFCTVTPCQHGAWGRHPYQWYC